MKPIMQFVLMMALAIPAASYAQPDSLCKMRPDLCGKKGLKAKKAKKKMHKKRHRSASASINLDQYMQQNAADPVLKQKIDTQQAFVEPKRLPLPDSQEPVKSEKDDTPLAAEKPAEPSSSGSSGDRSPASLQNQ